MSGMKDTVKLSTPLSEEDVKELKVGDLVEISGVIVTARDKAYDRVIDLKEKEKLPLNLENGVIYHCGPLTKKTEGEWKIFSAGPTTSNRLDENQVKFVEKTGVRGLIGKGGVGKQVGEKIGKLGCVYLAFTGGAGAMASKSIKSVQDVFWMDLGRAEAMWVLKVENFGPLVVGVDPDGNNLYF